MKQTQPVTEAHGGALVAAVLVRRGAFGLDVTCRVDRGETLAVLGPNGAGKSTLLAVIAGLLPLDHGRVVIDGVLCDDGGSTFVPPERRRVGVVFQDYLLFPHMNVVDNVAFGLRARGVRRAVARARAAEALERFGLGDRLRARPDELSGGQAQRVALARAIVADPRVLLLDEPLAALDQETRVKVRRELGVHLRRFAGGRVLVTHDPLDAAALADRLVIIEDGAVVQEGTFADVAAHPRSTYIAELVGMNLWRGHVRGDRVVLDGGEELVAGAVTSTAWPSGEVFAVVAPHAVALHRERPAGSPRNVFGGVVAAVEPRGERARVQLSGRVSVAAEVTWDSVRALGLASGVPVFAAIKATEVTVYPV